MSRPRVRSAAAALTASAGLVLALACSGPANLGQTETKKGSSSGGTSSSGGSSGSGTGTTSSSSGSTVRQEEEAGTACADFAAAKCAKFDACTQGVYNQVHYGDPATCIAREQISCLAGLEAPDNVASANGIEQCGKDITAGTCSDFFDLTNTTKACTAPVGPRANGDGCVNDGQCQSTWCYAATGAACGVCATRPSPGATCAENVDCGGRGMLCSVALTCAPVVALGGTCDTANPCGFGLSCTGSSTSSPGTCQTAGAAVGVPCDDARQVAPLCEHDLGYYCPSATDACAQALLVGAGTLCGVYAGDAGTPPPVDAGAHDAGTHDAGAHDAGARDAGPHDAGEPDATLLDAGDAGAGDASLADAEAGATEDAEVADTGALEDAQALDAEIDEAGEMDAEYIARFPQAVPSVMALCTGGAACSPSTATKGICIAPAADGDPCDTVNGPPCLSPARCVLTDDSGTTGVCAILAVTTCN